MSGHDKIDLFKLNKDEYAASRKPGLVTVRPAIYMAIDGSGAPGGLEFEARIGALYAMAYTVKMTRKFNGRRDYVVCKLETLYSMSAGGGWDTTPMKQWRWKMMIRTPSFVKPMELEQAVIALNKKGKAPGANEVALEAIKEGRCVQMLHVGPYDKIGETVDLMQQFAESKGLKLVGPHHEVYLSDPRRVASEKLKTIIREPAGKP